MKDTADVISFGKADIVTTTSMNLYTGRQHTRKLTLSVMARQTAGINLQTDLGNEDACIQNSFDVLQPP